jgi:hypothetical protein
MGEIYTVYRDEDGFLYITYIEDSPFWYLIDSISLRNSIHINIPNNTIQYQYKRIYIIQYSAK